VYVYADGMSALEKRLQVLLDEDRMARLAAEAKQSNRSVGAIVREAIDMRWAAENLYVDIGRINAASEFQQRCQAIPANEPAFDLADFNREYELDAERVLV